MCVTVIAFFTYLLTYLEVVEVVAAPARAAGAQAGAVEQWRDDEGEHDADDAGEVEGTAERGEGLGLGLGLGLGIGFGFGFGSGSG